MTLNDTTECSVPATRLDVSQRLSSMNRRNRDFSFGEDRTRRDFSIARHIPPWKKKKRYCIGSSSSEPSSEEDSGSSSESSSSESSSSESSSDSDSFWDSISSDEESIREPNSSSEHDSSDRDSDFLGRGAVKSTGRLRLPFLAEHRDRYYGLEFSEKFTLRGMRSMLSWFTAEKFESLKVGNILAVEELRCRCFEVDLMLQSVAQVKLAKSGSDYTLDHHARRILQLSVFLQGLVSMSAGENFLAVDAVKSALFGTDATIEMAKNIGRLSKARKLLSGL